MDVLGQIYCGIENDTVLLIHPLLYDIIRISKDLVERGFLNSSILSILEDLYQLGFKKLSVRILEKKMMGEIGAIYCEKNVSSSYCFSITVFFFVSNS